MAYELEGGSLGETFRLESPPTLTSSSSLSHRLAVTELGQNEAGFGFSDPLPAESSYLVGLQLKAISKHELWMDGKSVPVTPIAAGSMHIYDLERDPVCYTDEPFHDIFFYVPRGSLAELQEDLGATSVGDLSFKDGAFIDDPVVRGLGLALLHALRNETEPNQLLIDHALLALRSHLVMAYKGAVVKSTPKVNGLSPRHERTVKEFMRAHLHTNINLNELAAVCGLSPATFIRQFKQSVGATPHQWLIERRLDFAKSLMRRPNLTLADISLQAGFADQSHFTRTFTTRFGVSPAVWRKVAS